MHVSERARPGGRPARRFRIPVAIGVLALLVLPASPASSDSHSSFDFDHGNAAVQVVIPGAIPAILGTVSPGANDASLVLRITTMITNAWFDATAPYHSEATAVGVYSRLGHVDEEDRTDRNRNVALLHASYHVLNSVLPQHANEWNGMLASVGLDPNDTSDPAAAIGDAAGRAVVEARENDGMNQLGDAGGRTHNRQPYADTTGYAPVNTPYELRDPTRWQPQLVTTGNGLFRAQQFVTPQWGVTEPYSYDDVSEFRVPAPPGSGKGKKQREIYKALTDEVIAASANLTDEQKVAGELFDNKLRSLGFSAVEASMAAGHTLEQFIQLDFLTNMAAFDTGIAVWSEKARHDFVRPVSAIRHLYGDGTITAWRGPGQGSGSIRASEWRSYLGTADHPEYPSGSASFCSAHATSARAFFGTDTLNWSAFVPAGVSMQEPGITPAEDTTLTFPTWTAFEELCGQTRVLGGVHFQPAVQAGHQIGRAVAAHAWDYLQDLLAGTAPAR